MDNEARLFDRPAQPICLGWLVQPTRGTFKRPLGTLTWQKAVISLQTLLEHPQVVGERTALELQGFSHYPRAGGPTVVYLYGPDAPPGWLSSLPLNERFTFRKSTTLFKADPVTKGLKNGAWNVQSNTGAAADEFQAGPFKQIWGEGEWPLTVSSPERALLKLLDELPGNESFHQVDMLVKGLRNLGPRKLQKLLDDCRSAKVKRLLFWFADRHNHSWLKQIDRDKVDLGKGKRMLVKGGRLDPLITVPEHLSAPI